MMRSFEKVAGRKPKMDELNVEHLVDATISAVSETKVTGPSRLSPGGVIQYFTPELGDVVYFQTDEGTEVRGVVMSVFEDSLCETSRSSEFYSARKVTPIRSHEKYENEFG